MWNIGFPLFAFSILHTGGNISWQGGQRKYLNYHQAERDIE